MWTLLFGDRENTGDPANESTGVQDLIDIVEARRRAIDESTLDEGAAAAIGAGALGPVIGGAIGTILYGTSEIEGQNRVGPHLDTQLAALRNLQEAIDSEDIGAIGRATDALWDQGVPPNLEQRAREIALDEANRIAEERYAETGVLGDGAYGDNFLGDGVAYDYTRDITSPVEHGENEDDQGRPTTSPRPVLRPDDLGGSTGESDTSAKPIILDLDGNGIEINVTENIQVDFDGDGFLETGHWVGPGDGLLVLDLANDGTIGGADGVIDQAEELIWSLWGNPGDTDLQAFGRAFDSDNNGVVDERDDVWDELRIWQDLDQDGVTDDGELQTLDYWGITQINVTYDNGTDFDDEADDLGLLGSTLHGTASFVHDGSLITPADDAVAGPNGLYTAVGGVGDVSLRYNDLGYREVQTALGFAIEFENGESYHYAVLEDLASADIDLNDLALDGAAGDARNNTLDATGHSRSVQISGGDGNDTIFGGANDDMLSGDVGADVINSGDGNDLIFADAADFTDGSVSGGNGFDTLIVVDTTRPEDAPEDYVAPGVSVNLVSHGLEAAYGGDGDDFFSAQGETQGTVGLTDNVNLYGGEGNDTLLGSVSNDILSGDGGNDSIDGWHGDDAIFGGAGDDTLNGQTGDDVLFGGDGEDLVYGFDGDDQVYGGDGSDTLRGNHGDDTLDGGAGDDNIFGGDGDDIIRGGEGNDTIGGGDGVGDDIIFGGEGNDVIYNSTGDDVFHGDEGDDVFYHGGHLDYDVYFGGAGHDVLHLIGNQSQYIIEWTWASGYNQIQVTSVALGIVIDTRGVEVFVFDDGSEIHHISASYGDQGEEYYVERETTFDNSNMWSGWQDNNYVHATDLADYRFTGSGDDWIDAFGGADVIQAGQGNDTIVGGDGADLLEGASGRDVISGGTGVDTLLGLTGADSIWGDGGADSIDGGTGSDQLSGGDGNDIINGETGSDRIWGDAGNDSIDGGTGSDFLSGGAGDDSILGRTGDDNIFGGAGHDFLHGGYGADQLTGGDGNDQLNGNSGDDRLFGNEGDDLMRGGEHFDLLSGGAGSDTLHGDAGDDYLIGNAFTAPEPSVYVPPTMRENADSGLYGTIEANGGYYLPNISGSAVEYSSNSSGSNAQTSDYHALLYLASYSDLAAIDADSGRWHYENHGQAEGRTITFDALSYLAANDYLIAAVGMDPMEAVIHYLHYGQHQAAAGNTVHNLAFDPEQYLRNYADLRELFVNDYFEATRHYILHGYAEGRIWQEPTEDALTEQGYRNFLLNLEDGNDALYGGEGRDFLEGGAGADTIDGGEGILDTASYAASDGAVTIDLAAGTNSGGHAEGDVITNIESLVGSEFGDHLSGDDLDNTLRGEDGDDTLSGVGGHDDLYGGNGDDVIFGGDGNDRVQGGEGADTVDLGNGDDTFFGEPESDPDNEETTIAGDSVIGGLGDDEFLGGGGDDVFTGGEGDDVLNGGAGDDTLNGGVGADTLDGGSGIDTADYSDASTGGVFRLNLYDEEGNLVSTATNSGFAADDVLINIENVVGSSHRDVIVGTSGANTFWGGDGNDDFWAGSGDDTVYGEAGNDTFNVSNGADSYFGGAGDDTLNGGNGNDVLAGDGGFDVLNGGAGDDVLTGGANWDVFLFEDGFGNDIISDFDVANAFEHIDLSSVAAIADFDDLIANHASQAGGSTVIDAGLGNTITINGVTLTSLTASDFVF